MLPAKLAFVDIETTGLSATYDRIIEIAVLVVENNQVVDKYKTLINPQIHVPKEIELITGIYAGQLEAAPTFNRIKYKLKQLFTNRLFVAHNVRFDYAFVKNEFKREQITFKADQLCTMRLSQLLFPRHRHHSLDALIKRFKIETGVRHRAYSDVQAIFEFYKKVSQKINSEVFVSALKQISRRPSTPIHVKPQVLDDLPDECGVYIFYDAHDAPLYVGKSTHLKTRVLSHFSSDIRSSAEMKLAQLVAHIETHVTHGELSALLKEAELVKKLQPVYNRLLRTSRQLTVLKTYQDGNGFMRVTIETCSADTIDPSTILCIQKSQKTAKNLLVKMAKKHYLCEKLLGLEKTKRSCFGYQLGSCRGACIGKEKPAFYNLRLLQAFATNRIKTWPYSKPIAIDEKDLLTGEGEMLIFDRWLYLGKVTYTEDAHKLELLQNTCFDVDTYNILERFLRSTKPKRIRTIDFNSFYRNAQI